MLTEIVETSTRKLEGARNVGVRGDDDKAAIRKNLYLQDLHNRNETLYHRVLVDNVEELAVKLGGNCVLAVGCIWGVSLLRTAREEAAKEKAE